MFEPTTFAVLAHAMDACAVRQAVYSANIANVNVDGYRRMEVLFDAQAMRAETSSSMQSMFGAVPAQDAATQPQVVLAADTTVKLDVEMADMARNALRYQSLIGAYERSIGMLSMAIHEGKGT
jgi:flagellar basal-body rod protein FlgB